MSRLPRSQEYLKTGFTAEAASAARFRAYAAHAQKEGLKNLSQHWLDLAAEKDELAIRQLQAAEQVRGTMRDLQSSLAEEQYENEVLYAKLIADSDTATADVFRSVVATQKKHLERLEALREAVTGSTGDAPAQLPTPVVAR